MILKLKTSGKYSSLRSNLRLLSAGLVIVLLGVYNVAAAGDARITEVDVYLILGQSNAVGAGKPKEAPADDEWFLRTEPTIAFSGRTSVHKWMPDVPERSLRKQLWSRGDSDAADFYGLRIRLQNLTHHTYRYGPEMSLGKVLYYREDDYKSKRRQLALIKSAVGATPLLYRNTIDKNAGENWQTSLSDESISYIRGRLWRLKDKHLFNTINVKGLLWIQGGSDANGDIYGGFDTNGQPKISYKNALRGMVTKLKNGIGQAEFVKVAGNMPVVVVGLNSTAKHWKSNYNSSGGLKSDAFNNELKALASADPSYLYLPTDSISYQMGLKHDGTESRHYNGEALLDIGRVAAAKFLRYGN